MFSDLLEGVGRNRLDGGRKKGVIKVHTMMGALSGVAEFVRMTAAREHDRNFLYRLKPEPNSWLVFDKAYNVYHQFSKWTTQKIWFVTQMKAATKKSFANMITVIRLYLTSYVELFAFIKDTYKAWRKTHNAPFSFAT